MKKTLLALSFSLLSLNLQAQETPTLENPNLSTSANISHYSYHCNDGNTSIDFKKDILLNNHAPIVVFDISLYKLKPDDSQKKEFISKHTMTTPLGIPATLSETRQAFYRDNHIKTGNSIILHPILGIDNKVSVTLCYNQNYVESIQYVDGKDLPIVHSISSIQHFSFDSQDKKIVNLNNYQLEIISHKVDLEVK